MNTVLRILLNFIVVVVASSLVRIFEFFPSKEIRSFDRVGPKAGSGKAGWICLTIKQVVCIVRYGLTFGTFIFNFII